jgi:hypothetical protein
VKAVVEFTVGRRFELEGAKRDVLSPWMEG